MLMDNHDESPGEGNRYEQYYVVKKGDTLSKIAEEYYGDRLLFSAIYTANRHLLSDPNDIKPGQKLLLP